jgi:protein TonB
VPAYRLPSIYDRPPLRRRASGLALALAVNLVLILVLLGMSKFAPMARHASETLTIDLQPESKSSASPAEQQKPVEEPRVKPRPVPKPPPIILPVKPTIVPPTPQPWIEMTHEEMTAADVRNLPKAGAGGGNGAAGDSEVVGKGPHGEALYAAEWAREPTNAEIGGYWPGSTAGWGVIACKTVAGNRVEDCFEISQSPRGSHLASAVRQMAWQFRVRPPRKNGQAMVGEWVRILISVNTDEVDE